MKKMRNKLKYIVFIVLGIVIGSTVGIVATNIITANQVGYTNSNTTKINVQDAIDELYERSKTNCPSGKFCTTVPPIIYYNPVTNTSCTDYTISNSNTGTKTGCMKWYAYDEDDTTYTMILDHNTTAISYYNYANVNTSMGTRSKEQIKTDTGTTVSINEVGYDLEQLTSGWKVTPRLITGQEVADIIGNTSWSAEDSPYVYIYFDTNCKTSGACTTGGNKYAWLFDYTGYLENTCIPYGCNIGDSSAYGYWTSTAKSITSNYVANVTRFGLLGSNRANDTYYGLRPVITVNKSVL